MRLDREGDDFDLILEILMLEIVLGRFCWKYSVEDGRTGKRLVSRVHYLSLKKEFRFFHVVLVSFLLSCMLGRSCISPFLHGMQANVPCFFELLSIESRI